MTITKRGKLFLGILFILLPLSLFAEDADKRVALVPFWGDNRDIIAQFGEELYIALNETTFRPEWVDIDRLPPNFPPGGLPPHMNPGPMLASDVPFAITGQISFNAAAERWHLRLYLWLVPENRILLTDELVAFDREAAHLILPFMLNWLFSQVPAERPREPLPPPPPPPAPTIVLPPPPLPSPPDSSLVYIGLRLEGNLQMFVCIWGTDNIDTSFENAGVAASVNFQFLNLRTSNIPTNFFLGLQLEGIATQDLENETLFLTFPVLFRFAVRGENSSFSLLGGAFMFLPLNEGQILFGLPNEHFLWGYTAGVLWGRRVGPGHVNIGLRWSGDMFSIDRSGTEYNFFNRHTITISVGYELGVFRRR